MKPFIAINILTLVLATSFGCSMCCGPYDYDYPTFGGQHQRADRTYGRVGSLFSDPMADISGPSADSNRHAGDSALKKEADSNDTDSSTYDEDIENFKKELKSINPKTKPDRDNPGLILENDLEELPEPDEQDPTASRPRRSSQWQWR